MTITVPGMRPNKLANMDIDQLRGWAAFMDKAMIASLVATVLAVAALGVSTWLSFKYNAAVRAQEQAAIDRSVDQYRGAVGHSVQLEQDVAAARERAAALEREVSAAQGRSAALEQEVSAARERASALAEEAATARERAVAFEQAARDAAERAARAARESVAASEKATVGGKEGAPELDAAEIQRRVANLGKLVRAATARGADQTQEEPGPPPAQGQGAAESVVTGSAMPGGDGQHSPVVVSLRKYAGTPAAVFVLGQATDAPAAGASISAALGDADWAPQTWTWTGVAGIYGVVVLLKDGSDPTTSEAASALVEALRSAGFSATKGEWPADWRRFRGALDGPQAPAPTEAPIRIVVGAKPR